MDVGASLLAGERIRPLKRSEYDRLVEVGAFDEERVELLYGRIVAMSPQGGEHATVVARLAKWLTIGIGDRAEVRVQSPLAASDEHEPEPDVAIVDVPTSRAEHPSVAHLVIEVMDSSRQRDLAVKPAIYAAMGAPEYWVIDVLRREAIIHRDPDGGRYRQQTTVGETATLTVLRFADLSLPLADLFR